MSAGPLTPPGQQDLVRFLAVLVCLSINYLLFVCRVVLLCLEAAEHVCWSAIMEVSR